MTILVTCTGDRVRLFNRLAAEVLPLLGEQLRWLIVDDGAEGVPDIDHPDVTILRREKKEEGHTLPHNLKHGLEYLYECDSDKIIFIEDDDYYDLENYINIINDELDDVDLVGIKEHNLYNVSKRTYCKVRDLLSSPLATTAITKHGLNELARAVDASIENGKPYVDFQLWVNTDLPHKLILPTKILHLGFKQFPYGRKSHTAGQLPHEGYKWYRDYAGEKLMELIGSEGVNEWTHYFK